mgnify:CR=1 FL=1
MPKTPSGKHIAIQPGKSTRFSTLSMLASACAIFSAGVFSLGACSDNNSSSSPEPTPPPADPRAIYETPLAELNNGACEPGQAYSQEPLLEPTIIGAYEGEIETELVVRIRERCVPVWVTDHWEMQTLNLRTYGFPSDPSVPITEADADDPNSPNIAWSAPGPTFLLTPATEPGAPDGTRFKMRLYNRMPYDGNPHACDAFYKCNTSGDNAGINPETGECYVEPDPAYGGVVPFTPSQIVNGVVVEPPNCFHGNNSTTFHFHGFHVSPQLGQDFVGIELRPPLPAGVDEAELPHHSSHGENGVVQYGHSDYNVDPLRYTQAPGTHWYHAHKHGSTALQVLNGLAGAFKVRGEFDAQLDEYFETKGGGPLQDRLLVIQQIQEKQPGLGGADQTNAMLINGQANPIVTMKKGEIQRWRFLGATMQSAAALQIGFPDVEGKKSPKLRQIAMDGVQFSPDNYACQPFLNNPDCSEVPDESSFDELTAFNLSPGNRIDILIQAPLEAGSHCMVYDITTVLNKKAQENADTIHRIRAEAVEGTCGDIGTLGPLFTLIVEEDEEQPMSFPEGDDYPAMASFLADIPPVTDPSLINDIYYQMVGQGTGTSTQFWINQAKYNPNCANETLTLDKPEQWTLWNNNSQVAHPFHIHQNPFQLLSMSNRTPNEFTYPVWRDTLPIPQATTSGLEPNSDPNDPNAPWGHAKLRYVAKEFTGLFVNHCHILGHEDRGMMQNTQSACADGNWGTTAPVATGAQCDEQGFCPSDCVSGQSIPATTACPAAPAQMSDWPTAYGYPE